MKYISITNPSFVNCISFSLACSSCNAELTGKENFCPNCGKKLSPLPPKIGHKTLVNFLNDTLSIYLDSHNNFIPSDGGATDHGDGQSPSKPIANIRNTPLKHDTTEDNKTPTNSKTIASCPLCKTSPNGCPYLDNGICKGVAYPTFPPQYDSCVFSPTKN